MGEMIEGVLITPLKKFITPKEIFSCFKKYGGGL